MQKRNALAISIIFALWMSVPFCGVWGCDSTVRGKAFEEPRDVHSLCVVSEGRTTESEALASQLQKWLDGRGADFNAELVRLDALDEKTDWNEYGVPSAPPKSPVVMLVGHVRAARRSFVIDHWEPGPTDSDLEALTTSPVRDAIRREVGKRWAVLLYAPATSATEADAASVEGVLNAVRKKWADSHPPGISIVRLDRRDPRERLVVSFIGLDPSGPAWVGVVFGRGKLMAPPLEGAEIVEENLEELLGQLIEICSCLRPPSMMGVDVPMTWEPEMDKSVVSLLPPGFEQALAASRGIEEPQIPAAGRKLIAAAVLALGASALGVFGLTLAAVRRERRRHAVSVPRK